MKVKVIQKFRDKHTGEIHKVDDTMIISKERFAEIQTVGNFVEKVKVETEVKE